MIHLYIIEPQADDHADAKDQMAGDVVDNVIPSHLK